MSGVATASLDRKTDIIHDFYSNYFLTQLNFNPVSLVIYFPFHNDTAAKQVQLSYEKKTYLDISL